MAGRRFLPATSHFMAVSLFIAAVLPFTTISDIYQNIPNLAPHIIIAISAQKLNVI
jgi:hypothetical protein